MESLVWLYSPTQKAKIVTTEEAKKLTRKGWHFSPADFPHEEPEGSELEPELEPDEPEEPAPKKKKKK